MSTGRKLWKIIVAALLLVPLFAGALGANAVVFKDVPSNCTVVGNPMRII